MELGDLYVDLSPVVKSEGAEIKISQQYPIESFAKFGDAFSLKTPVTLIGTIQNHQGNLFLKGTLQLEARLVCDRCLTPFDKMFCLEMEDIITREDSALEADEYIPYQHDKVLLTDAIYKCIFAVTLEQKLCKNDCKGLCGMCGANRNETTCNCDQKEIDPRLWKLKELLK